MPQRPQSNRLPQLATFKTAASSQPLANYEQTKERVMERMLVVVFDNERNAYEASRALNQLDAEASITVHAESVISKEPNGAVTVKQAEGDFPIRTIAGTAIGSLIG